MCSLHLILLITEQGITFFMLSLCSPAPLRVLFIVTTNKPRPRKTYLRRIQTICTHCSLINFDFSRFELVIEIVCQAGGIPATAQHARAPVASYGYYENTSETVAVRSHIILYHRGHK